MSKLLINGKKLLKKLHNIRGKRKMFQILKKKNCKAVHNIQIQFKYGRFQIQLLIHAFIH